MKIDKETVVKAEMILIEGIKTSDVKLLDKLLHDDLLFLTPSGQMVTKQMDLNAHKAGDMTVERLIPKTEEVNIIDDTAISVMVYETRGTMLGNAIEGRFRYIRVWKMFPDGLKVIGGSCFKL